MAITRINNNQITDSVAGNLFLGVNAAVKIQDFTITAGKIQNNLTYGSDLTITGNLTVQGNTTAIDTVNLVVEDPLILLAKEQTGAPALDIGFIGKRGTEDNIAFVWDESAGQFVAVFTTSEVTNSTITINSFASLQVLDLTAANANIAGNVSFSGNVIGPVTVVGNVDANNFNATSSVTAGTTITATGNVSGGNVIAVGNLSGIQFQSTNLTLLAPTIGNTAGERVRLFDFANVAKTNYAIGVETSAIWHGVDTNLEGQGFKWYGSNVQVARLSAVGNLTIAGNLVANANITGANVNATANVTGTGAVFSGNVTAANFIGNIQGNIDAGGANTTIQFNDDDILNGSTAFTFDTSSNAVVATGNVTAGNVNTAGQIVATGNIAGGNISTTGRTLTGTLETTGDALIGGNLVVQGNLTYINIDDLRVEDPIIVLGTGPNGAPLTANDGRDRGIYMEYFTTVTANAFMGFQNASGNMIIANDVEFSGNDIVQINSFGNLNVGNLFPQSLDTGIGNVTAGNLNTSGQVVATGNVTGGNVSAGTGIISTTGNIAGGNINATANVTGTGAVFTGNVTADTFIGNISGNIDAGGANTNIQFNDNDILNGSAAFTFDTSSNAVVATGNVTAGNIDTAGQIVATGNVSGGNITTVGNIDGANVNATGNVTGGNVVTTGTADLGNIRITGDDITNFASNIITINTAGSDIDVRISGDTQTNLLVTDAGTDTVLIGTGTPTVGAALKIGTTDSFIVPVGNIAQRPVATQEIGMLRFSTTADALEVYDGTEWVEVGVPEFTVIVADAFVGDGSTLVFTLSEDSTTAGTIVAINGIVQEPTTAYAVAGNVLTFTEAPAVSDNIDARIVTTTTIVTKLRNTSGNAVVETLDTADTVQITGNLLPVTSNTFNLGSSSLRWNELFLQGSTITLGNVVIKNTGGNTVGFFGPDGTTPGAIDTNNIDSAGISNGTSSLQVISSGGNIRANVGGSTVQLLSSGGVDVTGFVAATGNVSGGNVTTAGLIVATGNITGGNLVTAGNIEAGNIKVTGIEAVTTLNVSGDTLISGNLTVSGTTITANVASIVITDPILGLGRGANGDPLTSNDGLDRGTEMFYYTTAEQIAFMGYDNDADKMLSAANVSIANNIVTVNSFGTTRVGTLETSGIVNTNANGVGNIGSATTFFNTVFAKATSAQYADLAEMYESDADYEPGTVLCFGGAREVTLCGQADSIRVAGVVSTNPSYLMNSDQSGDSVVAVALTGRVPTRVTGTIRKGDLMVSTGDGRAQANNAAAVGTVIGKALADFDGADGVIEVVVGRV